MRPVNITASMLRSLTVLTAVLMLVSTSRAFAAEEILVAAASDLQFAMPELAQKFEQQTGAKVTLTFGSSGNFTNQIRNGAPFDVFFSADLNYPRQLAADGLADPKTLYHYADGKIVLWTLNTSKLKVRNGLSLLLLPDVHRIAIANPEHAPYGKAAVAALKHEKLYEEVQKKFVLGENISQTAQFVESGSADVGILALSLALSPALREQGKYAAIPSADYPAIEQGAVVLSSSSHKQLAARFLDFLRTPESQALLARYGFSQSH
jgi:molybdate transport system substrate-binding protein